MLPKLLLAVMLVSAAQRAGGPAMSSNSEPTQFERFAKKLNLDGKQQLPDVQAIFQSGSADASPFERQMMTLRLRMVQLADKPSDFAAVQQDYAVVAAKMAAVEVKAFDQVRTLLKTGQLSKSAEAFAIMAGVFHPPTPRSMGRRGGGPPLMQERIIGGQRGGTPIGGAPIGGARMGAPGMFVRPTRLNALAAVLQMTDAQKKGTKEIMDAEFRTAEPLKAELTKARMVIGQAIQDEVESAFVSESVTLYAAPVASMAAAEMKALAKILESLTPEQRENMRARQTAVYLMRGAFIGKKWDTTPDTQFY